MKWVAETTLRSVPGRHRLWIEMHASAVKRIVTTRDMPANALSVGFVDTMRQ